MFYKSFARFSLECLIWELFITPFKYYQYNTIQFIATYFTLGCNYTLCNKPLCLFTHTGILRMDQENTVRGSFKFFMSSMYFTGLYGPPSKSNWTRDSIASEGWSIPDFPKKPIATCDFPGIVGTHYPQTPLIFL